MDNGARFILVPDTQVEDDLDQYQTIPGSLGLFPWNDPSAEAEADDLQEQGPSLLPPTQAEEQLSIQHQYHTVYYIYIYIFLFPYLNLNMMFI